MILRKSRTKLCSLLLIIISAVIIFHLYKKDKNEQVQIFDNIKKVKSRKMWASMALCWKENVDTMGPGRMKKEYHEAALLSSKLLIDQTEDFVSVIITIVHTGEPSIELGEYKNKLTYPRVRIFFENVEGNLKCPSQAQLTRMYVFKYDFIGDDDIIFTVDVDAFIIGSNIIQSFLIPHQVWISEYSHTEQIGETFNMNFVAMPSKVWRRILNFEDLGVGQTLEDHLQYFSSKATQEYWGMWGLDQIILTYGLLRPGRQLCSLPPDNSLWAGLKLEPSDYDDTGVCFHGDFMNCNKEVRRMRGGCSWWHFFPEETKQDMKIIYNKIVTKDINYNNTDLSLLQRLLRPIFVF